MAARQLEEVARNWEFSGKRVSITGDLNALFHDVNDRLNGEIFKPHACEKIDWDINAALVAEIIKNLYFPASPYLFDKIPVELLGSIYERYLGKTIEFAAKCNAPDSLETRIYRTVRDLEHNQAFRERDESRYPPTDEIWRVEPKAR